MKNIMENIYPAINKFLLHEGQNDTSVSYLSLYRVSGKDFNLPDKDNPYIVLIINGTLRLYFAEGVRDFTPGQYFISTIDSPRTGQTIALPPEQPFIALLVEFSVDDVISVMLDIDGDLPEKLFDEETADNVLPHKEEKLPDIIFRLLNMTPAELTFMGKHLKREIIFNLITGLYGKQFMQSIINIQQAGDIYYINSWIKQNYKVNFSVEDLAEQSNMSLSSFHQKFKSAVGMGPLQCQKKLRLMEARRLMLDKAANVTDAAMEVGYESVSQFIRDYRRMFGRTPQKDVQEIRDCIQKQTCGG